ncbi:MAG: AAA family ATPase [Kiritimatiellia bacterium]
MSVNSILELHSLAKNAGCKYTRRRELFKQLLDDSGKHFVGIFGPRGAGKTILLQQYALQDESAYYISADTLEPEDNLWDIVSALVEHYKARTILIDEIHFQTEATALLKKMYDFLDVKVIFSSSVALAMHSSAYDLSRRVKLLELRNFSFREYISFKLDADLPLLDLEALERGEWSVPHLESGRLFDDYLLKGYILPFALEEPDALSILESIVDKVIERDIPMVDKVTLPETEHIRNILRFMGRSAIDGISYSSLSSNLGITKYKVKQYVASLEKAFLLHRVMPEGTNVLREPKILMAPPLRFLYNQGESALGGIREDFFVESMRQAGMEIGYLKGVRGQKTPDYLIRDANGKLVVEIGGKGKGREQFKGINVDRKLILAHTDIPVKGKIPLFMAGFLA